MKRLTARRYILALATTSLLAGEAIAQRSPPPQPSGIAALDKSGLPVDAAEAQIIERLGHSIDMTGLEFKDETGQIVSISSYFNKGRPVIISFVYFECPSLCTLILNGKVRALKDLSWTAGKEFELITVSMDHEEGPDLAYMKKEAYLKSYGRLEAGPGWHFLTGSEANVRKLANELGFGFKYIPDINEYAHSAGLFVLTPDGAISRVLYGVEFSSRDLRLSLVEAGQGKIGTIMDRVMMFCYRYDPNSKGYALEALNLVKAGGAFTVFVFGGYLVWFWTVGRRRRKGPPGPSDSPGESGERRSAVGG